MVSSISATGSATCRKRGSGTNVNARNVIDTLFAAERLFYTCIVLLSEQCHIMQNARQWRNIFTSAVMMKVC